MDGLERADKFYARCLRPPPSLFLDRKIDALAAFLAFASVPPLRPLSLPPPTFAAFATWLAPLDHGRHLRLDGRWISRGKCMYRGPLNGYYIHETAVQLAIKLYRRFWNYKFRRTAGSINSCMWLGFIWVRGQWISVTRVIASISYVYAFLVDGLVSAESFANAFDLERIVAVI